MNLKLKDAFNPELHKEDAIERTVRSYDAEKRRFEWEAAAKWILKKRETEEAFGKTLDEEDQEKAEAAQSMSLKLKDALNPKLHKEDALERAAKNYEAETQRSEHEAISKWTLEKRETEEAFGKTLDEED